MIASRAMQPNRWRPVTKRRALVWFLVCAFLGLLTTVGVAWWAVWTTEYYSARGQFQTDGTPQRTIHWWTTQTSVYRYYEETPAIANFPPAEWINQSEILHYTRERWDQGTPDGPRLQAGPQQWVKKGPIRNHDTSYYSEQAAGWPRLALWKRHLHGVARGIPIQRSHGAMKIAKFQQTDDQSLPYLPIWPGLIFNTIFWGAAWFIILAPTFCSLAALKRHRRRRRGLCARCRYDLRGINSPNCPECGDKVRVRNSGNAACVAPSPLAGEGVTK